MKSAFGDQFILALTIWREASGEGLLGQTAVGCVVRNRAIAQNESIYDICVQKKQFSSLTINGDPNTVRWPAPTDDVWVQCQQTAGDILTGKVLDVTEGAHYYYNPKTATSKWFVDNILNNPIHPKLTTIGNHVFFK